MRKRETPIVMRTVYNTKYTEMQSPKKVRILYLFHFLAQSQTLALWVNEVEHKHTEQRRKKKVIYNNEVIRPLVVCYKR